MSQDPKYGIILNGWQRLLAPLEAHREEFPQLEVYRVMLASMLQEVRETITTQLSMAASKQEASQHIRTLLADGRKLATLLRTGIRHHYGNRSEKLIEFGLQPLRPRARAVTSGAKPPAVPAVPQP